MKKICSIILCLLIAALSAFSVSAEDVGYKIKLGDNYISAAAGEDLGSLSAVLGMSEDELSDYYQSNNLLLVAADKDNTHQLQLAKINNEFSELVGDMSTLDNDQLGEVALELSGGKEGYSFTENGGLKYIVITETLNDSGGEYTVTQFCTVTGGDMYRLSFYNSGDKTEPAVYEIFESFEIEGVNGGVPLLVTLLIVLGIAAFAAVAVFCVFSIIKERKNQKEQEYNNGIL